MSSELKINAELLKIVNSELDHLTEIDADDCDIPSELEVPVDYDFLPELEIPLECIEFWGLGVELIAFDRATGWCCPATVELVGIGWHCENPLWRFVVKYDESKKHAPEPD